MKSFKEHLKEAYEAVKEQGQPGPHPVDSRSPISGTNPRPLPEKKSKLKKANQNA